MGYGTRHADFRQRGRACFMDGRSRTAQGSTCSPGLGFGPKPVMLSKAITPSETNAWWFRDPSDFWKPNGYAYPFVGEMQYFVAAGNGPAVLSAEVLE